MSMEKVNVFNFESIRELCKEYFQDIVARKDLAYLLNGKRVRFVDKTGRFGYAYFGDFYFTSMGVMMLITKDVEYTWYHEPDYLGDSYWSTVPVLYAGVETVFRDDQNNPMFTGDIVTIRRGEMKYTLMYRWLPELQFPGLMADNHEVLLESGDKFHIGGNVFYDVKPEHFEIYDYWYYLGHNAAFLYHPNYCGGPNDEELDHALANASRAPYFENKPLTIEKYARMYEPGNETLQVRDDDVLFCFAEGPYEGEDGEEETLLKFDDMQEVEGHDNSIETVFIDEAKPNWEELENNVSRFILKAHRNPEIRYVVLSWEKTFVYKPLSNRLCDLFRPVYDYSIANIILPAHVMCKFIGEDSIGRD